MSIEELEYLTLHKGFVCGPSEVRLLPKMMNHRWFSKVKGEESRTQFWPVIPWSALNLELQLRAGLKDYTWGGRPMPEWTYGDSLSVKGNNAHRLAHHFPQTVEMDPEHIYWDFDTVIAAHLGECPWSRVIIYPTFRDIARARVKALVRRIATRNERKRRVIVACQYRDADVLIDLTEAHLARDALTEEERS